MQQTNSLLTRSIEVTSNNLNVFQNTDEDPSTDNFKGQDQPSVSKNADHSSVQKNDSLIKYAQTPKFMCESGKFQKQQDSKYRQLNIKSVSDIYVNKMGKVNKNPEKIAPYVPPLRKLKAPKRCFSDYVQNLDLSLTNRNEQDCDVANPLSNIETEENQKEIKPLNFDQIVKNFQRSRQQREKYSNTDISQNGFTCPNSELLQRKFNEMNHISNFNLFGV